jgi:hypothetical protein
MGFLRRLMESRPFATQRPDLSLLAFEQVQPWEMCLALRGDGFSLVYTPTGRQIRIAIGKLGMARVRASWFNPRDGRTTPIGEIEGAGERDFTPPESGEGRDWVLTLDAGGSR